MTLPVWQGIAALCWAIVIFVAHRGFVRAARGRGDREDAFAVAHSFVGAVQIGFTLRWYLFGDVVPMMGAAETSLWLALYVASSASALVLALFGWLYRRRPLR